MKRLMGINHLNIKSFINNNQNILSLLFVFIIVLTLGSILFFINSTSNILGHSYRDIYFYLIQALRFSGHTISGYGYVNYLSPLIPFLTSILFRLGFVSENSLFFVTMLFYILATVGMFCLFRLRFNNIFSIFGAILYSCLSINLMWAGNGSIDIPCICLSIWALYFFVKGVNQNQRYFYLALPLCVFSFFAKYIGALIFAIIILYFLSKRDIFTNIKVYGKNLIGSFIFACVFTIPFFAFYFMNHLPLGFLNQAHEISSTTTSSAIAVAHHRGNNLFFYFEFLPKYIYNPNHVVGYVLLILAVIGIVFSIYKLFKVLSNAEFKNIKFVFNRLKLSKTLTYILLFLSILGMIISFVIAGKFSFVVSEALFFLCILIFAILFNEIIAESNFKYDSLSFDIAMIGWFMGHMLFLSAHLTKVDRYATAFVTPLIFFITFGLKTVCDRIPDKNYIREIIPLIFIIIFIIMGFLYLTIDKHDSLVNDEQNVVEWLEINNPNLDSINISSDRGPIYTWYLQKEVGYIVGTSNTSNLSDKLLKTNTEYYISQLDNLTIPNYHKVKEFGLVSIYQRTV